MKEQKISVQFIKSIAEGLAIKTKQKIFKEFEPMTLLEEKFLDNRSYFYKIDQAGEVALYYVCEGEKDIDWILEDIKCNILLENKEIKILLETKKQSILFEFLLNQVESTYSIIKLALQSELYLYYVLKSKEELYYLGYSKLELSKQQKSQILRYVHGVLAGTETFKDREYVEFTLKNIEL